MGLRKAAVNLVLKGIMNILCRVDSGEYFRALCDNKPMIVMFNHINFLEVIILVTFGYPVNITGLAKSETWKNPLFAFLFNTYKAVPLDRTGAFSGTFKKVCDTIQNGAFVCIAPEGTRSGNGILAKGKAGIVQLALDADIPVLPVAHYGGESVWQNMRRFKRTKFHIRAGQPFRIKFEGRPNKEEREEIITEMMVEIAKLLPEKLRGVYSHNVSAEREASCRYLDFL